MRRWTHCHICERLLYLMGKKKTLNGDDRIVFRCPKCEVILLIFHTSRTARELESVHEGD